MKRHPAPTASFGDVVAAAYDTAALSTQDPSTRSRLALALVSRILRRAHAHIGLSEPVARGARRAHHLA